VRLQPVLFANKNSLSVFGSPALISRAQEQASNGENIKVCSAKQASSELQAALAQHHLACRCMLLMQPPHDTTVSCPKGYVGYKSDCPGVAHSLYGTQVVIRVRPMQIKDTGASLLNSVCCRHEHTKETSAQTT